MFNTIERKAKTLISQDSEILSQYNEAKNELKAHNFEKIEVKSQIQLLQSKIEDQKIKIEELKIINEKN